MENFHVKYFWQNMIWNDWDFNFNNIVSSDTMAVGGSGCIGDDYDLLYLSITKWWPKWFKYIPEKHVYCSRLFLFITRKNMMIDSFVKQSIICYNNHPEKIQEVYKSNDITKKYIKWHVDL